MLSTPLPPPPEAPLMHRMARALGINIGRSVREGELSRETATRMARHCEACCEAEACRRALNAARRGVSAPPDFCANRNILMYLRKIFQRKNH